MAILPRNPQQPDVNYDKAIAAIKAYVCQHPTGRLSNYVQNYQVVVKRVSDFNFAGQGLAKKISIELSGGPADRHCLLFVTANWQLIDNPHSCTCDGPRGLRYRHGVLRRSPTMSLTA